MNVLLISPGPPRFGPFPSQEKSPPLGLAFMMASLKKEGHNAFLIDYNVPVETCTLTDFLVKNEIDVVGISANTVWYQSALSHLNQIAKLKQTGRWNGTIIVGGPHTAACSSTIPEYVNHIVLGEGELALNSILAGSEKQRIVRGATIKNLDDLPFPSWEDLIYRPYDWCWKDPNIDCFPIYPFSTSRGCPHHCTFCSSSAVWGNRYRCMSASRIVDDIEFMIRHYGLRGVCFREDNFTHNKERVIQFCELLLQKNIRIKWISESRADSLSDYQFQKLMSRAGCVLYYIGVESGSERMLRLFGKGETLDDFRLAFGHAKKLGILTLASFIVGGPTETNKDREDTHRFMQEISPDFVNRHIYVGLPGTTLHRFAKKEGLYEYEDPNQLLYMKDHDKYVEKYYDNLPYAKIPSKSREFEISEYEINRIMQLLLTVRNKSEELNTA